MNNFFRVSLTCVILITLTFKSYAQDVSSSGKPFNIGLMLGFNASRFTERIGEFGDGNSNEYDEFLRFGAAFGLTAKQALSKGFNLRAEFLLNARGGSYRSDNTGVSTISTDGSKSYYYKNYRVNYLEVPLLADFDLSPQANPYKLHVHLAFGLSYGINVSSSLRYNGFSPTGTNMGPVQEVKEDYEVVPFDYARGGITNGIVELSFDFRNNHDTPLFVRTRYTGSLSEVYEVDSLNGDNMKTKMTTWTLSFGVYFLK